MPEDRCNPLQICGSIVHISGVQLHLKRAPRAVFELDDRASMDSAYIWRSLIASDSKRNPKVRKSLSNIFSDAPKSAAAIEGSQKCLLWDCLILVGEGRNVETGSMSFVR